MDVYAAVADPVRRQILELLAREPLPAGRVAEAFGHISRPAVSRHLRLLREADLVHAELAGRERIYRADTTTLGQIEAWIVALRRTWDRHLDALDTEVRRTRREREHGERRHSMATEPDSTKEQTA